MKGYEPSVRDSKSPSLPTQVSVTVGDGGGRLRRGGVYRGKVTGVT